MAGGRSPPVGVERSRFYRLSPGGGNSRRGSTRGGIASAGGPWGGTNSCARHASKGLLNRGGRCRREHEPVTMTGTGGSHHHQPPHAADGRSPGEGGGRTAPRPLPDSRPFPVTQTTQTTRCGPEPSLAGFGPPCRIKNPDQNARSKRSIKSPGAGCRAAIVRPWERSGIRPAGPWRKPVQRGGVQSRWTVLAWGPRSPSSSVKWTRSPTCSCGNPAPRTAFR